MLSLLAGHKARCCSGRFALGLHRGHLTAPGAHRVFVYLAVPAYPGITLPLWQLLFFQQVISLAWPWLIYSLGGAVSRESKKEQADAD